MGATMGKPTKRQEILDMAFELLEEYTDGLRYTKLKNLIHERSGQTFNVNTIDGTIWNLDVKHPDRVAKPERGLFQLRKFVDDQLEVGTHPENVFSSINKPPREEEFYGLFADWLVKDREEVTKAVSLGGNIFQDKWGTPDVIGIRESRRGDLFQMPTELVAVEMKTDINQMITAFGQACCYHLFSHKVWLVIPEQCARKDVSRLDSLCQIFGIGLVTFDATSLENPSWRILARPIKHEPDWFYVNQYLQAIKDKL
jgi:hypothetical protein